MRRAAPALCVLVLGLAPSAARADIRDYLGRTILDVRVEVAGTAATEASTLQLIETRIGQSLTLDDVRESIDHLIGVGRFEDVRVFAAASPDANGVVLTWTLVPVQRVADVAFAGRIILDERALRAEVIDRLGPSSRAARVPEAVTALTAFYAQRGYRGATIAPRLVDAERSGLARLVLAVAPGAPTVVGDVRIEGDTDRPIEAVLSRLGLARGRVFDRPALDARVDAFEESLREDGHYEARVSVTPTLRADERTVDLTVTVEAGPLVRVVFAGDGLAADRRDALVPIRQERSVDLDLLEDASRNIEAFLRQQGYRQAQAPYVREVRAAEMVLTFTVQRGPLHHLASIEVAGNVALPTSDITPLLALKPGDPLIDSQIGAVAAALAELYRVRGFASATVTPELTVVGGEGAASPVRQVAVRLVVVEGTQTRVGTVRIDGTAALPESRARAGLALTAGRPFYRPQFEADRVALERLYDNEGFRDARVQAETALRDAGATIDIVWRVEEGDRTLVEHVLVTGNARTGADLIRREMVLKPGGPLGEDALIESQQRLAALGLFRRVRITELTHPGRAARDVMVDVEEAPSTTLSYGGGLEAGRRSRTGESGQAVDRIEVAPRGFFEVTRRNLWGKNRSISLFTRLSFRASDPAIDADPTDSGGFGFNEYRMLATFREPRPFDAAGDLQLTGFLEQAIRPSFNFARRGVRLEYARRATDTLTLSGRYAFDRTRLFDEKIQPEDRLLIDRLFPQVRLSMFTVSLLRDSRDDVLDPARGTVVGVDGSLAPRSLGSEVGFAKSFLQGFVYRRLPGAGSFTLAAGLRVGVAVGFDRQVARLDAAGQPVSGADGEPIFDTVSDLPASERFFAGGDNTVRGFVLDRLGTDETLNEQGFPTGGSGLVVANVELRTSYWKGLGGVWFVDAGNVFKDAGDLSLSELRPAAGAGVRYRSPLGPLRVDFGYNLNRRVLVSGDRERGLVFHISLGQAF